MSLDRGRIVPRAIGVLLSFLVSVGLQMTPPASAQPTRFKEAPMLAEQVKTGKLPPVEKRLPENPLVVSLPSGGRAEPRGRGRRLSA